MDRWLAPLLDTLHRFARQWNCVGIEAGGRKGWEKALGADGWKPEFVVFGKQYHG